MSSPVYSLDDTPDEREGLDVERSLRQAQNLFGLELMQRLVKASPRQNVLISPFSVWNCGVWLQNGARGETKAGLRRAFEMENSTPDAPWNAHIQQLRARLTGQQGATIRIANGLWSELGYRFDADFERISRDVFGAEPSTLNFRQPQRAAQVINDWVAEQTGQKITQIVNQESIGNASVVLANAVYFKAMWRTPFDPSLTQMATFENANREKHPVKMMREDGLGNAYVKRRGFQAARLPYLGSSYALWALLPDAGTTPLNALNLWSQEQPSADQNTWLNLKLPRFTLDFSADLSGPLSAMGAHQAFGINADFSKLGHPAFGIGSLLHKTRIEVDEKGTVAAAVTAGAVAGCISSPISVDLTFDRPFALVLVEETSRTALFTGIVNTVQRS